ncbi:UDP-4-amino-4,6-dideoxy-N-acetyl-beta-L-altrosamine transaminase [Salinivirga cyanobacteriivorans]|uniref:UDP-4-amino-4, 6-dideoxy-N-acetyl-beta-L-altrosamine transaminase n=1 Tax=Salinivirga cyanobacteriivorans TaxID=1307839 RepID=A0A0S2HZZ3_9BACT|nr:DegT/DnrJ/EryC1/StrS family aminotransferase [Salinivirga cyanobacteriivorans]ALO15600.1 UDP-4-amino-4,6-dideoxy-N-acetyl-beta-L-altrosamine transaminase [Salinivirga cyanobacteriivorans]
MKYSLASSTWDEKEKNAMLEVIETGMYTMGEKVKSYEEKFANYFGSKYAVMVNSGSSANLLATAALFYRKNNALKPGDEVIVPAVSWSTTYHPLQQYNLHLKFVDIDLDTLNYDLEALKNAVTEKTRMILAVNLLGNSNDFDEISKIIGDRDIILLEDNCESMDSEFNGIKTGTFGLMGTFSSFFSHHISTMEGGMVVTDDEELYHIMLSMRSHGWTRHLPDQNMVTGKKSNDPFEESFKFVLPGYNLRPGELHGAVGIEQLKKLPRLIEQRRKNAQIFQKLFSDHPYLRIQKEVGASSWFGFSMVLKDNAPYSRNEFVELLNQHEIECRPIVSGNFLKNPVLKHYDYSVGGVVKNAEIIDQKGLFVGNHHYDLKEQLMHLKSVL